MTQTPTASPAPARSGRPRGFETAGDMVRSLALVLVVVAVVVLLTVREGPDEVVPRLNFGPQLEVARQQASYDVLAPVGLARSWKPTSARGSSDGAAVTWHLGIVTPAGDYAAVEQSDGSRAQFLDQFVSGSSRAGTASVGGVTWRRLEGGDPEPRALVRTVSGATTLVAGSASWAELRRLAGSLQGG